MELTNIIISGVLAILGAVAAQLIFFRQNKRRLQVQNQAGELENKSKQAEEWRKLYEEELGENRKKDELIKHLYRQVDDERKMRVDAELALAKEKGRNGFLSVIKCKRFDCAKRIPPYREIAQKLEESGGDIDELNEETEMESKNRDIL